MGAGNGLTVTVAVPEWVVSWVDVAITVAVPVAAAVKTPALLTAPIPDGLTDQVTALLKFPVPVTVGVQVEVWVGRMDDGEHATATEVMVTGMAVTVTLAEPDLVESCVEVAVTVSDPEAGTVAGAVYSPELEIVPEIADQVTAEL